jgi:MscS family membrane protein
MPFPLPDTGAILAQGQAPEGAGASRVPESVLEIPGRLVDWAHGFFPGVNEGLFRWIACAAIIAAAVLLRRLVTALVFRQLERIAGKGEAGIGERLFAVLQPPAAALLMVCAIFAALTVLVLSPAVERLVTYGTRVALTGIVLWGIACAGGAILDHLQRIAWKKDIGVAAFMPLIKKTLAVIFVILGILLIAESLGADVKTFLAGLGIGGLAFALAAQDTLANMFGSFVVVMDRPFRVGDYVRIGANEGSVEDIGLRSTRLRTAARTQIVLPNKTVASEAITNFSRMPQRRVDQKISLGYGTTPDEMDAILGDIRSILGGDPDVHPGLVAVNFTDYGESTLDIQIVYFTADPDWQRHLDVRERINLKIMRAMAARGLAFALPTSAVIHRNGPGG